jgi:flagellar protein FlaI
MLFDLLLPAMTIPVLVSLNGILSGIKEKFGQNKDLLPPESPHAPAVPGRTGFFSFMPVRAAWERTSVVLCKPTWESTFSLAAVAGIAIVSAIVLLLIELPLVATLGLTAVFLVSAAVSFHTIRRRQALGAWLPEGAASGGITLTGVKTGVNPVAQPVPGQGSGPAFPGPAGDSPVTEHHSSDLPFFVAELPDDPSFAILERYWVVEPYSYVTIKRVGIDGFTYIVSEPPISKKEKTILVETYLHLRDIIIYDECENSQTGRTDPAAVARIIRNFDPEITDDRIAILNYYINRDLSGYGPLEALMRDPALEDISCNGNDLPVFIFHRAYGSLPTSIVFSEAELNQFVLKLAQKANKQLSLSNPMVDATLPDGARIQITYSEVVSTKGSSFTIRKFRAEPMTPLDLIRFGTYDARTLAFLWLAIENRKSLLVVGGTASGKTSMMNAVSLFIPQNAKVVSLEDTREIQLPHKNWLPTQTRELNAEGIKGDIDLFSLLKACMRQRPEYIIVGEVRGQEAQTLFQAMNSGHATLSTIHAGSVHEAINRLTHDPINVPPVMFQALDIVVVQSIYTVGKTRIRRCLTIHEIEVDKTGNINPILLFEWDIQKDTFTKMFAKSKVLDEIAFHRGWDEKELEHQLVKRGEFFSWALEVEPPTLRDLANAIHDLGD